MGESLAYGSSSVGAPAANTPFPDADNTFWGPPGQLPSAASLAGLAEGPYAPQPSDTRYDVLVADASGKYPGQWQPASSSLDPSVSMMRDTAPGRWEYGYALPPVEVTASPDLVRQVRYAAQQDAAGAYLYPSGAADVRGPFETPMASIPGYTPWEADYPDASGSLIAANVSSPMAESPLPAGWNMRDASAALVQRDYEARLANAPSMTAWSGVSVRERLEATASTIDAISGNPMGAAGYLLGRAAGIRERDAATMAVVGSAAGELLALRAKGNAGVATRLGNRKLPDTDLPWVSYQRLVTGRNYEEVWRLDQSKIALDARRAGFTVEAKWTGRNDAAWTSSPYNPSHRYYDEAKILNQARSQLELNAALRGNGVRFAVSNDAAQQHFTSLFQKNFGAQMNNGTLQVWHVPGNGMR